MPCSSLPPELWQQILEALCADAPHADATRDALLALSLTCSSLRYIAQKFLCRDLIVRRPDIHLLHDALSLANKCGQPPWQLHVGTYPNHMEDSLLDSVFAEMLLRFFTAANLGLGIKYASLLSYSDAATDINEFTHARSSMLKMMVNASHVTLQGGTILFGRAVMPALTHLCVNSVELTSALLTVWTAQPHLEHIVLVAPRLLRFAHSNFLAHMSSFNGRLTVINPRARTIHDPFFKRIHRDHTYLDDCAREQPFLHMKIYKMCLEHTADKPGWSHTITQAIRSNRIWDLAEQLGQRCGRGTGLSVPY